VLLSITEFGSCQRCAQPRARAQPPKLWTLRTFVLDDNTITSQEAHPAQVQEHRYE